MKFVKLIQKLVKQRKESAQQYNDAGRPELAANELAEVAEMEVYLPKQLSEDEVRAELVKIIDEVGASQPSDMGKVIGKQGRIAKALRTVVKAAATKQNKKVIVEIVSEDERDVESPEESEDTAE